MGNACCNGQTLVTMQAMDNNNFITQLENTGHAKVYNPPYEINVECVDPTDYSPQKSKARQAIANGVPDPADVDGAESEEEEEVSEDRTPTQDMKNCKNQRIKKTSSADEKDDDIDSITRMELERGSQRNSDDETYHVTP